jgi:hypothetical protein
MMSVFDCKQYKGKTPKLFNDKIVPEDANQGNLGNCYLISSMAALAEFPNIIKKCFNQTEFKKGQSLSVNYYVGGILEVIKLDDAVPVGTTDEYAKFTTTPTDALWPMFLEKASAKVYGAYWNIGQGGTPSRALKDLTGAPTKIFKAAETPEA